MVTAVHDPHARPWSLSVPVREAIAGAGRREDRRVVVVDGRVPRRYAADIRSEDGDLQGWGGDAELLRRRFMDGMLAASCWEFGSSKPQDAGAAGRCREFTLARSHDKPIMR